MNTYINQSPCGDISLPFTGGVPVSGATLDALARRGRCLRSAAMLSAGRAVSAAFKSVYDALRARYRRQQAIAELSRLNDVLLADIGIARADIPLVIDGLISKERPQPLDTVSKISISSTSKVLRSPCPDAINDDDCRRLAA